MRDINADQKYALAWGQKSNEIDPRAETISQGCGML
jgi:hypothetical protein